MTWADFYLMCFAIGFLLSVVSFLTGGLRWQLHLHLPHGGHIGAGHLGGHAGVPAGGANVGNHAGAHAPTTQAGTGQGIQVKAAQAHVSPFNFVTLTAFLAWFGGTGFLVTRFSSVWFALGLLISVAAGLCGAAIVFLFLTRVLMSHTETMDSADYEMVGVLGRTSIPIRQDGTGEIIYSQAGTRRTCGARSEHGAPIEKGAEIIVTHYDKGIAYVRLWEEFSDENSATKTKN